MLLMQTAPTGVELLPQLGVIAAALVVGLGLGYRYAVVPERARADRGEAEVKRLNAMVVTDVLPVIIAATAAAQEYQAQAHALLEERERKRRLRGDPRDTQ